MQTTSTSYDTQEARLQPIPEYRQPLLPAQYLPILLALQTIVDETPHVLEQKEIKLQGDGFNLSLTVWNEYHEPLPVCGQLYIVRSSSKPKKVQNFAWVNAGVRKQPTKERDDRIGIKYWTHKQNPKLKRRFIWLNKGDAENKAKQKYYLAHICVDSDDNYDELDKNTLASTNTSTCMIEEHIVDSLQESIDDNLRDVFNAQSAYSADALIYPYSEDNDIPLASHEFPCDYT